MERVLGVSESQSGVFTVAGLGSASTSASTSTYRSSGSAFPRRAPKIEADEADMRALRVLAEAVESAVRGERTDVLGLDWEAMAG